MVEFDEVALLERLQQNHSARHRNAKPEDDAVPDAPAPQLAKPKPKKRRKRDLAQRARYGDAAHRKQVGSREMQADAKHQKNDADLGKLACHCPDRPRSPA